MTDAPRLRLRVILGPGVMIGPGKADLLGLIHETGSIAAAGRRMGMSYKRAWMLVEAMNAHYTAPLVESSRGGATHGGAVLTDTGLRVLACYRRIETRAAAAAEVEVAELRGLVRDMVGEK